MLTRAVISKTRFVTRFLLTYACVLVPLIAMYLVITNHMVTNQRNDNYARMAQQLSGAVTALNTLDDNYNKNSFALMEHQDMIGNAILTDEGKGGKVFTLLRTVRQFDNVCDDMFVYYGEGGLYTARGFSSIPAFFENLATEEGEYDTAVRRLAEPNRSVTIMHGQFGDTNLFLCYPIRLDRFGRMCSVHYILPIENVCDYLAPYFTESEIILRLNLDAADDPIYLVTYSEKDTIRLRHLTSKPALTGYTTIPLDSTVCGARIEMLYRPELYEQQLRASQTLSFVLLCIGLAAALLISFLFTRSRWQRVSDAIISIERPKKSDEESAPKKPGKLRAWLHKFREKHGKPRSSDEFDYIQALFEQTRSESNQLEQALRANIYSMRQQTAMLIFYGMVQEPDEIRHMLSDCGLTLTERFFYLCGVALSKNDPSLRPFDTALIGDLHCVSPFNDGQLVLMLIELPAEDHFREKRIEMAQHLRDLLQDLGAQKPRIAMSQVYQPIEKAKDACMEVMSMLESNLPHTDECWDSRIPSDPVEIRALNPEDLSAFSDALQSREQSAAEKVLRRMDRYIYSIDASDENRWYMRYCLVQAAAMVIRQSPNRSDQPLLSQLTKLKLSQPDEFAPQMQRIIHAFCSHAFQKEDFPQIIAYIEENYGRPDLSLQEIADSVKMTKPQMSRMFKAQTNTRYVDYVLRLRMTSARDMLLNTDKQIKEIFPLVGFTEKSNFSRKYREYYGESPSATRIKAAAEGRIILAVTDEDSDDADDEDLIAAAPAASDDDE